MSTPAHVGFVSELRRVLSDFFTGGGFAWLGFLIIGLMLLRPTWLIAAGVYGVWAIAAITIADEQARIITGALLAA